MRALFGIAAAVAMVVLGVYGSSTAVADPPAPADPLQPTAYTNPVTDVVLPNGRRVQCVGIVSLASCDWGNQ